MSLKRLLETLLLVIMWPWYKATREPYREKKENSMFINMVRKSVCEAFNRYCWEKEEVGTMASRTQCATCGTESTAMYCSKCHRELQAELFTAQSDASFWHHLDDEALSHAQYWKQHAAELKAMAIISLREILEEVYADCDRDVIETAAKAALLALGEEEV